MGPKAGVDYMERRKFLNLPGLELRPLGRSARSQSLYQLRYPGSVFYCLIRNEMYILMNTFILFVYL
jgi:hypothetical protein